MIHVAGPNGRPLCMGHPDVAYDGHYVFHLVPDPAQSDCPECQEAAERGPEPAEPEVEQGTTHQADVDGRPACGFKPAPGERVRVAPDLAQVNCPACLPVTPVDSGGPPGEVEGQAEVDADTSEQSAMPTEEAEAETQDKPPRRRRGRGPAAPVTPNDETEESVG